MIALSRLFPVVALLGARQVGKTTLARMVAERLGPPVHWFDLENPADLARLSDPGLALAPLAGLVVIDEIQRSPELFPLLRYLVDRPGNPMRLLVLGSAAPELLRQGSETLAGRVGFHVLDGFALSEVGPSDASRLWLRGGFPRSFLAETDEESLRWRGAFIQTFLERDLPQLGARTPSTTLRRFWTMVAHYHGQTWNGAELARAFGTSEHAVRRWLDLLSATYVLWQLQPWHENLGKRQVRSPKVYVRDTGLLHALLGLGTPEALEGHPKVGASWEGFAIGEIIHALGAAPHECFFWGTHTGAELDLLVVRGEERRGFEIKRTSTPRKTRSMATALVDLKLDTLDLVCPVPESFPLSPRTRALSLTRLREDLQPLGGGARPQAGA